MLHTDLNVLYRNGLGRTHRLYRYRYVIMQSISSLFGGFSWLIMDLWRVRGWLRMTVFDRKILYAGKTLYFHQSLKKSASPKHLGTECAGCDGTSNDYTWLWQLNWSLNRSKDRQEQYLQLIWVLLGYTRRVPCKHRTPSAQCTLSTVQEPKREQKSK